MWRENIFKANLSLFSIQKQDNLINTPAKLIKPCTAIILFFF